VQKRAEPIKMPFGMWTPVGPSKHYYTGSYWRNLANMIEPVALQPFSQPTLTTCCDSTTDRIALNATSGQSKLTAPGAPHLIHASLDPLVSKSQTASRSVQPFLHSSR